MKERERLGHLLRHWMAHNAEHAETYREWAEKASSSDDEEMSRILGELYEETKKLNSLFEEALKKL